MEQIHIKDTVFSFENSKQAIKISFELLSNSKEYVPASGKPQASRPEASWVTMQKLMQLLDLKNIINYVESIFVSGEDSFHPLTTEERSRYGNDIPVKLWIFNRLIAKIGITIPDTTHMSGMSSGIAFAYNKNGIQIAFGTNVHICSNFSILSGKIFSTYGEKKIPYENIMQEVSRFIDNLPQWQEDEITMINKMISTPVGDESDINELIGLLLRKAVYANTVNGISALNVTETSEMVKEIIKTPVDEISNVWQLFNIGTYILNFSGKVNLMDAIDKHLLWRDVICEKYGIYLPNNQ